MIFKTCSESERGCDGYWMSSCHNRFYHSSARRTQFTSLDLCFHPVTEKLWRRKWLPTPVFLLRESCGQRSLVGCSPWVTQNQMQLKRFCMHACMHRRRNWQPTPAYLAWRIPGTEELGWLLSMGSHRVGHN